MAKTRAQERAARFRRRAQDGDMELAAIPRRGKDKCFVNRTRQQPVPVEDARKVVLSARCRHLERPDTEENRLSLSWSLLGDPAGRAISLGASNDDDRNRMWDTFVRLDRAVSGYHHRILGRGRFAKIGKTEYIPERFETTPEESAHTDARDEAEKDRDAVNAWMRWHGYLGHMDAAERTAIWDAVWLRVELTKGPSLTVAGQSFVRAMRVLVGVVNGRSAQSSRCNA